MDSPIIALMFGIIAVIAFFAGFYINSCFAENYSYNMTKSEIEQYNLSELCYAMEDDLTIEALDDFCKEAYGGIDTDYGDKIK